MSLLLAGIFSGLTSFVGGIDFVLIFQLLSLALVVLAGPAVVVVLALRGGDM